MTEETEVQELSVEELEDQTAVKNEEALVLKHKVDDLQVVSLDTWKAKEAFLNSAVAADKLIVSNMKKHKERANARHKRICSLENEQRRPYLDIKEDCKVQMDAYTEEQRKIQEAAKREAQEAAQKIADEAAEVARLERAAVLEAEAKVKAEEAAKQAAIAQEKANDEAVRLEAGRKAKLAAEAAATAQKASETVVAAPIAPVKVEVKHVAPPPVRKNKKLTRTAKLVDFVEFCGAVSDGRYACTLSENQLETICSQVGLKRFMERTEGSIPIPGVEYIEKNS